MNLSSSVCHSQANLQIKMNSNIRAVSGCYAILMCVFVELFVVKTFGQVRPHAMTSINALTNRTIIIGLQGSAANQFRPYFDIYRIERSRNFLEWTPLPPLLRTNNSSASLIFADPEPVQSDMRFYRTFTNILVTPLPLPTGPYAIGTTSRLITDPSRTNRYNVKTNGSFMISLWYPSLPQPGIFPSPYVEPQLAPRLASLYGITQSILSSFYSHSFSNVSVATNATPYPVIIYSHGFNVSRRDNTAMFQELASHGYIVVSIDHADCLATVFPDGRVLVSTISSLSPSLFANDINDVRFVIGELNRMNEEDSVFKGSLDMKRIGTMGWSYGGGVAGEICRTEERVKAAVLLEAYLQNADALIGAGLAKPFLSMYQAASGGDKILFNKAIRDSYWLTIKNTAHQNFSDWLSWVNSPSDDGRKAAFTMNSCMVSFFNKYLKDADDHVLDDPVHIFPQISAFATK
jgi:dienelactone hydrolase